MGLSQMDVFISIVACEPVKDTDGFGSQQDKILHTCRAYKNVTAGGGEHTRSGAAFAEELTVFQFRRVPGLKISPEHFIIDEDGRYNVTKVDNAAGRGMYVIVTAALVTPSKG